MDFEIWFKNWHQRIGGIKEALSFEWEKKPESWAFGLGALCNQAPAVLTAVIAFTTQQ